RATLPRVSGPQYYTYKTDPLVRVDFAAITLEYGVRDDAAMAVPEDIDHSSVGSTVNAGETPREAAAPALAPDDSTAAEDVAQPQAVEEELSDPEPAVQALSEGDIAALQDFALLVEKDAADA